MMSPETTKWIKLDLYPVWLLSLWYLVIGVVFVLLGQDWFSLLSVGT
jgi:hypothetical protein